MLITDNEFLNRERERGGERGRNRER